MRGEKAKLASKALGDMLDAIYDWERKTHHVVATGSDDDDVVVTHNSRGALIELSLRSGLQKELTTPELEYAINDAIAENTARLWARMAEIGDEFLARCAEIEAQVGQHPVGDEMVTALNGAKQARKGA